MTADEADQLAIQATVELGLAVVETVKRSDWGVPSGQLYAMMMGSLNLDEFHQLMGSLVRTGLLTLIEKTRRFFQEAASRFARASPSSNPRARSTTTAS